MDFLLLAVVVIFLILGVHRLFYAGRDRRRIAKFVEQFPGPARYPFFGTNLVFLTLKKEELYNFFRQRAKQYFPVFRSWLGSRPIIHIINPEHAEIILRSTVNITKSFVYDPVLPWLGRGLITSTGAKWQRHRKLITPAFHFKILENFLEVFVEKSQVLVEKLSQETDGNVFDIFPYISRCSLDIICETAMGIEINAMSKPNNPYLTAVHGICEQVSQRLLKPWLQPDAIFYRSGHGRRYNECLSVLHGVTNNVIKERKEDLRGKVKSDAEDVLGRKKRLAFLDLLIESSRDGAELSDEEIREEVDTFMFAGHDTTAAAMNWTLFFLGLHLDVQDEVYQEIQSLLPNRDVPTMSNLGDMKLMERVIKESLRLHPSVANITRVASEDIELGGCYTIPKGCAITLQIIDVHRDPTHFPNPTEFNPDRFLPENSKDRHPYAFIPFSAGPRNCIGQRFAMLEIKTVLTYVLRNFKIKSTQTIETVQPMQEIVLRPLKGLLVTLEPRI